MQRIIEGIHTSMWAKVDLYSRADFEISAEK